MKNSPKSAAQIFRKQYSVKTVDSKTITKALKKMGYAVIEFNTAHNDPDTASLISALKIDNYIKTCRGFTFANSKYRIVFIHESLSPEEKTLVLAHEAGHICCDHFSNQPVIGNDVIQEHEANEFAHHLLYPTVSEKITSAASRHKKLTVIIASLLALCIIGGVGYAVFREDTSYRKYYVTDTGFKYHLKDCPLLKDNPHKMTKEEFENKKYSPCQVCMPDKED